MRNFLTTSDFSLAELAEIIEVAIEFKTGKIAVNPPVGKSIALVFFNPSFEHALQCKSGFTNSSDMQ
jgi:ornithine carbamoyltransferase